MTSNSSALTPEGTATYREEVEEAASALRAAASTPPTVGVLNDAGLSDPLGDVAVDASVPFGDLPHYPASEGVVTMGTVGGTQVAVLEQTLHLYEGDTPRAVTFPVRMLVEAGVETLLLPATAGSVNPQFAQGDLMALTNHINFQGQNPLVGPNVDAWGPRFPDMTEPYAPGLQQLAAEVAQREGFSLQQGVYVALLGPHAETTAEHRMVRRLGGDVVGATVALETIAARHMGAEVFGVVLLTQAHGAGEGAARRPRDGDPVEQGRSALRRLLTGLVEAIETDRPSA